MARKSNCRLLCDWELQIFKCFDQPSRAYVLRYLHKEWHFVWPIFVPVWSALTTHLWGLFVLFHEICASLPLSSGRSLQTWISLLTATRQWEIDFRWTCRFIKILSLSKKRETCWKSWNLSSRGLGTSTTTGMMYIFHAQACLTVSDHHLLYLCKAIHGYRETEKPVWNEINTPVIERLRKYSFDSSVMQHVHVLDLAENGHIKPHLDSVKVCSWWWICLN